MISHRGGRTIENRLQTTNRCDSHPSHPEHSNSEGVIRLVLPAYFSRMFNFTFTTSCVVVALASGSFAATKRGLAFADSDNTGDIAVADGTQVSWVYNWGSTAPSYLKNTDMTYIPMQWGEDNANNFMAEVQAQNAKTILVGPSSREKISHSAEFLLTI